MNPHGAPDSLAPSAGLPWWRRWRTILLGAFLLVALAVGVFEVAHVVRDNRRADEAALEVQADIAATLAAATELFLSRYAAVADVAARAIFEAPLGPDGRRRLLAALRRAYPDISAIDVLDASGRVVHADTPGTAGRDGSGRDLHRAVADGAAYAVSDLIPPDDASGEGGIGIAAAGRDPDGALLGVVALRIPAAALGRELGPPLRRRAYPLVVDRAGRAVVHGAHPDDPDRERRDYSRLPPVADALAGRASRSARLEDPLSGIRIIATMLPIPRLGWAAGAVQPVDTAIAPWPIALRHSFTTAVAILAIGAVLAVILGTWLSQPIAALSAGVAALARADLGWRIPVRWRSELGWLAEGFNRMAGEIERASRRQQVLNAALAAANQDLRRRIAELKTLRDVNPVGIAIASDASCERIEVNPALARLLGVAPGTNGSVGALEPPGYRAYRGGRELTPAELPMRVAAASGHAVLNAELDIVRRDGARFQVLGHAAPLFDEQGRVRGCLGVFVDITEHKRAEASQRFLAEASVILSASLDLDTTLTSVARLAVPGLADWCFVDLLGTGGAFRRVAVAQADPGKAETARRLHRFPPDAEGRHPIADAARSGRAACLADIPAAALPAIARDAEHLELLRAIGVRSAVVAPLVARGRTLGTISFVSAESGRRYGPADLPLVEELARRAAIAVDNARLYQEAQEAAIRLRHQLDFIGAMTTSLDEGLYALDASGRITFLNPAAERMLGWQAAELLGRNLHEAIHFQRADGTRTSAAACPLLGVIRSGVSWRSDDDTFTRKDGRLVPVSVTSSPIVNDGRIVGAMLAFQEISERKRAEEALRVRARQQAAVAELSQQALAGSRLSTLLGDAAALVSSTLEIEYVEVLELLPGARALCRVAAAGWPAETIGTATVPADPGSRIGEALRARRPVVVADWGTEPGLEPPLLPDGRTPGSGVTAVVHGEPSPFGVLSAQSLERRRFNQDALHFLQAVANVLASAIERRRVEEERERLVRELEAERRRLAAVIEQMPAGVIIAEAPSGRHLLFNAQVERILGRPFHPAADVEHYTQYPGFRPDGRPYRPHEWPLARAVRHGEVVSGEEIAFLRGDGTCGTLRASAAPIRDRHGRIITAAVTLYDVTEQKRAEAATRFLAEASRQLSASLDHEATLASVARLAVAGFADSCIVYLVEGGRLLRRASIAHRDPGKEAVAQALDRHPPPDPAGAHPVATALRTGRPAVVTEVSDEWLAAVTHGPEHLAIMRALAPRSLLTVPLVARGRTFGAISFGSTDASRRYGPADLALAEDLARRAALAVDNARLYHEAQQAVRARDDFLARASHELRTPLTVVKGNLALLSRRPVEGDAEAGSLVATARRHVDQMTRLLTDLLDASRLAAGRLPLVRERLELGAVVIEALAQATPLAQEKDVALVDAVRPGLTLAGDRLKLEQVVLNLMTNAIKHTPCGGTVRAEGDAVGAELELRVRDTGEGIPREHLERIFEPFFQVGSAPGRRKAAGQGAGLGLAIVKRLVELHGGRVWAESEGSGCGSTFVVRLPAMAVDGRAA